MCSIPSTIIDSSSKTYNSLVNACVGKLKLKMRNKPFNIVYMNSSINKSKIGRYLLQKKYANCDFAVIWNFDQNHEITWFSIVLNKNINIDKNQLSDELYGSIYGNIILVQIQGLVKNLTK